MAKDKYSHRERLEMIFAGEKPDRWAASFWRHFFHMEHHAEGTADAMLWFQKQLDWDFMKINPRADYHVQDWGVKIEYSHDEFKKHRKVSFPIKTADDWTTLKPLSPTAPVLAEHLKVVSMIRNKSDKELPLLMTVFSPLSIAGRLVPNHQMLVDHLRSEPEKVERGLDAITQTFSVYANELRNAGADGLFFATTHWASSDLITWEEYQQFGIPYDLEVIRGAEIDAINLLHICDTNNFLEQLAEYDYQAAMYNWDSHNPTNLPIDRAYDLLGDRTIVGGVDDKGWLLHGDVDEVRHQTKEVQKKHDMSRLILGPDCAIEPEVPMENLKAIRERL